MPSWRYACTFSMPTRASRICDSRRWSASSPTRMMRLSRPRIRAAQDAYCPERPIWIDPRNVRDSKLHCGTRIQHDCAFCLQAEDLGRAHRHRRRDLVKRGGALTVQFHIAAEVFGARREAVGQKMNEVLASACLKRVVGAAFFPDGG